MATVRRCASHRRCGLTKKNTASANSVIDSDDAVIAGTLHAHLELKGTPIGAYDLQIAAQGLSRILTIITHNIEEFRRVPNLRLEDWVI